MMALPSHQNALAIFVDQPVVYRAREVGRCACVLELAFLQMAKNGRRRRSPGTMLWLVDKTKNFG